MAQSLGMVRLVGVFAHFLQANSGGGMHCSNSEQYEEETFFLIEIAKSSRIYTLVNYKTGTVLQRHGGGATNNEIKCIGTDINGPENRNWWRLIPGDLHGAPGLIAFQSPYDDFFMVTRKPGDDAPGQDGEVSAEAEKLGENNLGWHGWWKMETVTEKPHPGGGFWQTIGGVGIKLVSVVVQQLLQDLIAAG